MRPAVATDPRTFKSTPQPARMVHVNDQAEPLLPPERSVKSASGGVLHPTVKGSERARQWKQKQEKKHGSGKVLGILAARLARAVYHMLRKSEAFDENRFWNGQVHEPQPTHSSKKQTKSRRKVS